MANAGLVTSKMSNGRKNGQAIQIPTRETHTFGNAVAMKGLTNAIPLYVRKKVI